MFFPDEEGIGENECDEVLDLSDPYSISRQREAFQTLRIQHVAAHAPPIPAISLQVQAQNRTQGGSAKGGAFVSDRYLEAVSSFSLCPSTTPFVCDRPFLSQRVLFHHLHNCRLLQSRQLPR